jgi:hypothetical protein
MLATRMVMAAAGAGVGDLLIPIGLIIPFNTVTLPAGWTRFASADDKRIIGAGSAYDVGDSGGDAALAFSFNSEVGGAHSSTVFFNAVADFGYGDSIAPNYAGGGSSGAGHVHVISGSYAMLYQKLVLGKATAAQSQFPADAIVLGKTSSDPLGGLTNIFNSTSRGLMSGSSIADGGGFASKSASAVTGAHLHGGGQKAVMGGGETAYYQLSAGKSHNHALSMTLNATEYYKRYYLSAWTKTSGFAGASGMIAMWEGTTAPPGWRLCNGSGGSLNLQDYFIMLSTAAAAGSNQDTSNYIAFSGSLGTDSWQHGHKGGSLANTTINPVGVHNTDYINHEHDISENISHTPAYYALTFVEKI